MRLRVVAETPQAQRGVEADSPTRRGTPKFNSEIKSPEANTSGLNTKYSLLCTIL